MTDNERWERCQRMATAMFDKLGQWEDDHPKARWHDVERATDAEMDALLAFALLSDALAAFLVRRVTR